MVIFPTVYGALLFTEIFLAIGMWQLYKRKCAKGIDDEYPMIHRATIEKGTPAETAKINV